MSSIIQVPVAPLAPERFETVLGVRQGEELRDAISAASGVLGGRVVWNVSSTAKGGGVAEMLRSLIAYAQGAGVDARWCVIQGEPDFFRVTKRIHNMLHGSLGDGGGLGRKARHAYEATLEPSAAELTRLVRPGDIVLLHDPQTAGLAPALCGTEAHVVWRSHIGMDVQNHVGQEAVRFLLRYLGDVEGYVFSRRQYAWRELDGRRVVVIPPSIDAFSAKNQPLSRAAAQAILHAAGIIEGAASGEPAFTREDGTPGLVERRAELHQSESLRWRTPIAIQVSRWDALKDPLGVIRGFADHAAEGTDAHLVLAGPATEAVSDDPEGAEVLQQSIAAWQALPAELARRVHIFCLPMDDTDENAAMVNALQRHARVVIQKSLAEGFGLTVAEAMWKGRPVIGSRVGGIQDQVVNGGTGYLLDDPSDLVDYGRKLRRLLEDRQLAERMGQAGRRRVRRDFLGPRHLIQYMRLFDRLGRAEPLHDLGG